MKLFGLIILPQARYNSNIRKSYISAIDDLRFILMNKPKKCYFDKVIFKSKRTFFKDSIYVFGGSMTFGKNTDATFGKNLNLK